MDALVIVLLILSIISQWFDSIPFLSKIKITKVKSIYSAITTLAALLLYGISVLSSSIPNEHVLWLSIIYCLVIGYIAYLLYRYEIRNNDNSRDIKIAEIEADAEIAKEELKVLPSIKGNKAKKTRKHLDIS